MAWKRCQIQAFGKRASDWWAQGLIDEILKERLKTRISSSIDCAVGLCVGPMTSHIEFVEKQMNPVFNSLSMFSPFRQLAGFDRTSNMQVHSGHVETSPATTRAPSFGML